MAEIRSLWRSREEVYQDAHEGRQFDAFYFAMLVFACLIALLGLLLNSPAVIIGAMLISPLMGPILSCGLGLTLADWQLGQKAARNVLLSVVETIVIAALATSLSPLKDATPEILARTNPNLMDLLVAFFSGLAGTLAMVSRKSALTILPGVAIATAVMPPLATVGYGLSTRQWSVASGSLMLFFTNFTAIVISAGIVFLVIGFRPAKRFGEREHGMLVRYRILIAVAVLAVLSVPLMRTLTRAAQQSDMQKRVRVLLQRHVDHAGKRRLAGLNVRFDKEAISVTGSVQTATFIEPQEMSALQDTLAASLHRPVRLDLEQLQLARAEPVKRPEASPNRDFVGGGLVRPVAQPAATLTPAAILQTVQAKAQTSLQSLLQPAGVDQVLVRSLATQPDGSIRLAVEGTESTTTDPNVWKVAAGAIGAELNAPVHLVARLTVSGQGVHPISYKPRSTHPTSAEIRKAGAFLAHWKSTPNLTHIFVPPADGNPELSRSRISYLEKRFPVSPAGGIESDKSLDANAVLIQLLQQVDVSRGPSVPATPKQP